MDDMILRRAAAEIEAEKSKREVLKVKTLKAKTERDRMLNEAKKRKDY
jgi:hypothetical protein